MKRITVVQLNGGEPAYFYYWRMPWSSLPNQGPWVNLRADVWIGTRVSRFRVVSGCAGARFEQSSRVDLELQ